MNSIKERATATKILCFYCPRMVHTSQKGKDPSTTPLKMAFNINMTCGTSEYTVEIYPIYPRTRIGGT